MKKITYVFLMTLFSCMLVYAWSEKPREELRDNIVRLHILANGNSRCEQAVKLKVRDDILSLSAKLGREPTISEMEKSANDTLKREGAEYSAEARYEMCEISRREYEGFDLPKGEYTAVRILLGRGEGDNWWCVLSPPLCFTRSSVGECEKIDDYLSKETTDIIKNGDLHIKFRALELASYAAKKLGI